MSARLEHGLGLLPLAAIVFFNVSGGPYGIEDTMPAFGPGLTLLLLVLTPLVWSLPVALVMAELASAMPDEGGYVTWTTRAFGPFWGFQVGWWSWLDSFVDVAVYPALFVEYARFWHPGMTPLERWGLALAFIAVLTALNLVGVRPTGRAAVILSALTLVPVAALVIAALATASASNGLTAPWRPFLTESQTLPAGIGLGLAVVMWNYSGWDTPSTVLGETKAPERAFRAALLLTLPVIAIAYLLPVGAVLASPSVPREAWRTGAWPVIAEAVGGVWLGRAVALGAIASTAGLFLSLLLTNSRLPYVLARDGALPRALGWVHPHFGTPWAAVLASSVVYAACAAFSFKELIILNVWLYSLALLVELAAFVRLRLVAPAMVRPWRVPGGTSAALGVAVLPGLVALLAMATATWANTAAGIVAALTGPLVWAATSSRAARYS